MPKSSRDIPKPASLMRFRMPVVCSRSCMAGFRLFQAQAIQVLSLFFDCVHELFKISGCWNCFADRLQTPEVVSFVVPLAQLGRPWSSPTRLYSLSGLSLRYVDEGFRHDQPMCGSDHLIRASTHLTLPVANSIWGW